MGNTVSKYMGNTPSKLHEQCYASAGFGCTDVRAERELSVLAGAGSLEGRTARSRTPIAPTITMSWGLSFLCIPCDQASTDMIVIVNAWARVDQAPKAISERCLAGCFTASNRKTPSTVLT